MLQTGNAECYFGYFGNQKQKYEIRDCILVIKWQSKKLLRHMKKLTQTYRNVYIVNLNLHSTPTCWSSIAISLKSSHIPVPVLPFGLSLPLQGLARPELQRSCETGSSSKIAIRHSCLQYICCPPQLYSPKHEGNIHIPSFQDQTLYPPSNIRLEGGSTAVLLPTCQLFGPGLGGAPPIASERLQE